jgi:hypothetical protein
VSGASNLFPTTAFVPRILVSRPWPLPTKANGPVETEVDGVRYLIGAHRTVEEIRTNRETTNPAVHVNLQHLACVLFSGQTSLKRMSGIYSRTKCNYGAFKALLDQFPTIWVSRLEEDGETLGRSAQIMSWETDSIPKQWRREDFKGRVIVDLREGSLFSGSDDRIEIDLDYLQGASLGRKVFYFLLVQRLQETRERERLVFPFMHLEKLLLGRQQAYMRFLRVLHLLEGDCVIDGRTYRIKVDLLGQEVYVSEKKRKILHDLAEELRSRGVSEDFIQMKFGQDLEAAPDWVRNILGSVGNIPPADLDKFEQFFARVYLAYVREAHGFNRKAEDLLMRRVDIVAKEAAKKPADSRIIYAVGSFKHEAVAFAESEFRIKTG